MLPGFRDIAKTLLARAIAMIGPFGVSIITARVLGPEDRGHYFLIVSYALIAAQIANLGLHASNTYLAANRPELTGRLVMNSLYVAALITPVVALAVVMLVGRPELLGFASAAGASLGSTAFAAILLAPLLVASLFLTNLAVGVGRVRLFNGLTIFYSVATVATSGLAAAAGGGTLGFILAAAVAVAATCALAAAALSRGVVLPLGFDMPLFSEGIVFAFKAYLTTLLGFLMLRVGVIALQQRSSLAEIGQFSVATQISDALTMLPATISILLFPMLLRTESGARWNAMWRTLWRLGAVMAIVVAVVALAVPWVTPLLFGGAFQRAVPLTLTMLPSVLIFSLTTVVSQYLAAEGYPWRQVHAWLIGFLAQTGLTFWLARPYGGVGVAIGLAASGSLVLAILMLEAFAMRRRSAAAALPANGDPAARREAWQPAPSADP